MPRPSDVEDIALDRAERQLIRLALKRHRDELHKEQKRSKDRGVPNPMIIATLLRIEGNGNIAGLLARLTLDGDLDAEEKENGKRDPKQLDWTVAKPSPVRERVQ